MVEATFRFYEELNDFLAPERRRRDFSVPCARAATVKHMIEALGVPHTEVEVILVNGESVGLGHALRDGDRVAVYPVFERLDVTPLLRVRAEPLRVTRFLADAHLSRLARLLRMAGFDTRDGGAADDAAICAAAAAERRIVLTRDRELLKRRTVTHGCYVHARAPREQFREIVTRLDLGRAARPFTRCMACNTPLRPASEADLDARVPEEIRRRFDRFNACDGCGRVYWPGSHWERLRRLLVETVGDAADGLCSGPGSRPPAAGGAA